MATYAASTSAVSTSTTSTLSPTHEISTASTPNPTHQIEISLEYLQSSKPYRFSNMNVGETVRYFSKDGQVTIHLSGQSPFHLDIVPTGTQVPGDVILTLVKSSEGLPNKAFQVGCSVTRKDGTVVGWQPGNTSAGGEQSVGRPGH